MNPYIVLNVRPEADDQEIRRAYLEAIKQATPEKEPARFQELTQAYEKIKDRDSRIRYDLFDTSPPGDSPSDVVVRYAQWASRARKPLDHEKMKAFLQSCLSH